MTTEVYKGNNLLKRHDVPIEFSKEEVEEFIKCSKDVIYFASNYIKIVHPDKGLIPIGLYDYQLKLLDHLNNNRYSLVMAARQSGKCVGGDSKITIQDESDGMIKDISIKELYEETSNQFME